MRLCIGAMAWMPLQPCSQWRRRLALIIRNVQALRAIAANGVVLSHLAIVEQKYSHAGPLLPDDARFGAFGVDLFFVISGFIMMTIVTPDVSWRKFIVDRAWRILPPYWFYTTLVLFVSLYAPTAVNSSFAHPPSLLRSYLLIPDTVDPLLAVGWTLIHETYFYLCFALMLFLAARRGFALSFLLLTWMLAVLCFGAALHVLGIRDPVAAVAAHPLTLEFISGAAIGILIRRKFAKLAVPALVAGIIVFAFVLSFRGTALALISDRTWMRPILIGLPCALIVYGLVAMEIRGALAAPEWLVTLGDASYSTYLSHVLVLSALGRLFAMTPNHNAWTEAAFVVACIMAANAFGLVSRRLIEHRPGKDGARPGLIRKSGAAVSKRSAAHSQSSIKST
jgi:exopolysaccharide production protein ExoZ